MSMVVMKTLTAKRGFVFVCMVSAMALSFPAPAGAQSMRGLIEKALDEPAAITLENIELPSAIKSITEQTGVRVEMADSAFDLLPYGRHTMIEHVDIANLPLRTGLANLFNPLGMTFAVVDDHVEVTPKPAVANLGRVPTWEELDTLSALSTKQLGTVQADLDWLRSKVQFGRNTSGGWEQLALAIRSTGAGVGDDVLTKACDRLGWLWSVNKNNVVIESIATRHQRLLSQPISVRINNKPFIDVLQGMALRSRVPMGIEPGALSSMPQHMSKNFSVNVEGQPAERVLESIAAYTGLGYYVSNEGVVFYNPDNRYTSPTDTIGTNSASSTNGTALSLNDPIVGKIITKLEDGSKVEWLIRKSELPADLKNRRDEDLRQAFDALRRKSK